VGLTILFVLSCRFCFFLFEEFKGFLWGFFCLPSPCLLTNAKSLATLETEEITEGFSVGHVHFCCEPK